MSGRATGEPLAGLGVGARDDDLATRVAAWWLERLGAAPDGGDDVAVGTAPMGGDGTIAVEIDGPPGLDDAALWARSGLGWITRLVEEDGSRGGPAAPADREASVLAGTAAAIAALAALWAREAGGPAATRLAVDRLEVLSLLVMQPLATVQIEGERAPTLSAGQPGGVVQTRDGLVYARPVEAAQWRGLLARIPGLDTVCDRLGEGDLSVLPERRQEIDDALRAWMAEQRREQVVDAVQADHVPLVPVLRPDEVREDPHLAARGYEPGSSLPWLVRLGEPAAGGAAPAPAAGRAGAGPLAGMRVLDLTWAWAGPFATTLLADLGAEVVNIEWIPRFSNLRCQRPFPEGGGPPDASGWWSANQRGKRSVGVDFRHADGIRIVHELAAASDLVIENFSPGVVDRRGIGYEDLLADNPRLVYVSMSAFGKAGPYSHYVGYGTHIHAASGGAFATGQLSQMEIPYPDPVSGFAGALGALAYVLGARRTGRPAFLDVSELECTCALLAAAAEPASGGAVDARSPAEVLADPWLLERGFFVPDGASGLQGHDVRIGGPLFAVDGRRLPAGAGAPDLFADTRAVLAGTLGYDEARIDRLYAEEAVR